MAHTLAAHLLQRHFDAAFLADNAAIFHALVFAAQAFVILDRAKDTRAEQAVTLGFERAVVDGLGLFDLAIRPRENPLRRGQGDFDLVKRLDRRNGVERVVCQFLVHFDVLKLVAEGGKGIKAGALIRPPPHPGVPCSGQGRGLL